MINLTISHTEPKYIKLCGGHWIFILFPEYPKNATVFVSDPFGCTAESLKKAKELLGDKDSVYFQYDSASNVWTYIDENGIKYCTGEGDYLNNTADDNQVEDNQGDNIQADDSKVDDNQGDNSQAASIIEDLKDRLN